MEVVFRIFPYAHLLQPVLPTIRFFVPVTSVCNPLRNVLLLQLAQNMLLIVVLQASVLNTDRHALLTFLVLLPNHTCVRMEVAQRIAKVVLFLRLACPGISCVQMAVVPIINCCATFLQSVLYFQSVVRMAVVEVQSFWRNERSCLEQNQMFRNAFFRRWMRMK